MLWKTLSKNMTTPFTASFCSLNVRGLNQARKRRQLFRWLHNNKFDIVFLQETYSSKYIENPWKSEWGGKIYFCHGTSHSRGVMIMFNPKLDALVDNIEVDKNGRYLLLQTTVSDTTFQLCNIYSPNNSSDQITFFSSILDVLRKRSEFNIIIGGDFNCALTPQDKLGGAAVGRKNNVISEITKLCDLLKLQDVWTYQHADQAQFTWRDKAFKVQCRLDYWLVYKQLSRIVINTEMKSSTLTDHSAITLTLQSKGYAQRGPGFWKFNHSLRDDHDFVDQLNNMIPAYKNKYNYLTDKGFYWDMIKMEMRGFCVQYSKRKNRERRNIEKDLSEQIDAIMKALATNRSKENITKLYRLRSELNKIVEYRTKGAIIRSRTKWHEQGEKNTKYFLNLEKRQKEKTYISKLKPQDSTEITNADEILNCQKLFYKNLYSAVPCENPNDKLFFENLNLPQLNEVELEELERPLTKEECFETLKLSSKGKCPGSDGFTVESHNWIKSCILIGLRSEVFSAELRVENEARWYCCASTSSISSISG